MQTCHTCDMQSKVDSKWHLFHADMSQHLIAIPSSVRTSTNAFLFTRPTYTIYYMYIHVCDPHLQPRKRIYIRIPYGILLHTFCARNWIPTLTTIPFVLLSHSTGFVQTFYKKYVFCLVDKCMSRMFTEYTLFVRWCARCGLLL